MTQSTAEQRAKTRERVVCGDPVRGLAAIAVLLAHASYGVLIIIPPGLEQGYSSFGVLGPVLNSCDLAVPMFFVLSAYLIGRPFVHALIRGDPMPSLSRYASSRALRIVPAFWVIALLVIALNGIGPDGSALDVLAVLGFAQIYHGSIASGQIGQAWTLNVEIAFYALLPLAVLVAVPLARRATPAVRTGAIIAVLALAAGASVWLRSRGPFAFDSTWIASPAGMVAWFAPGLALAAAELPLRPWLERHRRGARALTVALGLGGIAGLATYMAMVDYSGPPALLRLAVGMRVIVEVSTTALLFAALLVRQWSGRGCPRWLDNAPLHWLGIRTLSFYLVHQAIVVEAFGLVDGGPSVWTALVVLVGLGLPGSLLAAAFFYRYVERPFLERKRAAPAPAPVVAPAS